MRKQTFFLGLLCLVPTAFGDAISFQNAELFPGMVAQCAAIGYGNCDFTNCSGMRMVWPRNMMTGKYPPPTNYDLRMGHVAVSANNPSNKMACFVLGIRALVVGVATFVYYSDGDISTMSAPYDNHMNLRPALENNIIYLSREGGNCGCAEWSAEAGCIATTCP